LKTTICFRDDVHATAPTPLHEDRTMNRRHVAAAAAVAAMMLADMPAQAAQDRDLGRIPFDLNNPQVQAEARTQARKAPLAPTHGRRIAEDHSGRKQAGKASFYAPSFQGKKMADGRRFNHGGQAAASKTLPLGTVAKVTNLETGKTAEVTVEDRGPYVEGRTIDLTKSTAQRIGLDGRDGVAPVVVAPIAVPQPDGSVKPGAGALPGPATATPPG
jgi:rare lipoprotein A